MITQDPNQQIRQQARLQPQSAQPAFAQLAAQRAQSLNQRQSPIQQPPTSPSAPTAQQSQSPFSSVAARAGGAANAVAPQLQAQMAAAQQTPTQALQTQPGLVAPQQMMRPGSSQGLQANTLMQQQAAARVANPGNTSPTNSGSGLATATQPSTPNNYAAGQASPQSNQLTGQSAPNPNQQAQAAAQADAMARNRAMNGAQ